MTPDAASLARLLRQVDPGLTFVRARNLAGGVSAQVTAVAATTPDGEPRNLVVRRYSAADLSFNPHVASTEYQLLALLHEAGLPVPRPYLADDSCAILPAPCLVLEFIDGDPPAWPTALPDFTGQLAAALADLHKAGIAQSAAGWLPDGRTVSSERLGTWPALLDESISELAVRVALTGNWPPPQVNQPVVLHGDYWPGNTLWRHGRLLAVIDWEDAAVGDPLADLGNARLEILMHYGQAATDAFTRQYRTMRPDVDLGALPYWDLYAALRPTGQMDRWGLPEAQLEQFRAAHRMLVADALVRLGQVAVPSGKENRD
ncbi:MAG: phosphotransferase family protein [Streptosporangiaceae bacterium]